MSRKKLLLEIPRRWTREKRASEKEALQQLASPSTAFIGLVACLTELLRRQSTKHGMKGPRPYGFTELNALVEGWTYGSATGKAEGEIQAKAEVLVCILVKKFGALTPSLRKRIRKANLPDLEYWLQRAIAARNLSAVFNPPRKDSNTDEIWPTRIPALESGNKR